VPVNREKLTAAVTTTGVTTTVAVRKPPDPTAKARPLHSNASERQWRFFFSVMFAFRTYLAAADDIGDT
jgi:hypothetical protein